LVEKVADLVKVGGGSDQLQATEIVALRDGVDEISFIDGGRLARGVEVFDARVSVRRDDPVAESVEGGQLFDILAGGGGLDYWLGAGLPQPA
jgi:hypothetical protein